MYADYLCYLENGGILEEDIIGPLLKKASHYIDTLTFRRIKAYGFDNLADWKKEIIKEVSCNYAEWLYHNEALLETYLKSYSLNGASMTMEGAWNVYIMQGVAIPSSLYTLLENTGLCNPSLHYRCL